MSAHDNALRTAAAACCLLYRTLSTVPPVAANTLSFSRLGRSSSGGATARYHSRELSTHARHCVTLAWYLCGDGTTRPADRGYHRARLGQPATCGDRHPSQANGARHTRHARYSVESKPAVGRQAHHVEPGRALRELQPRVARARRVHEAISRRGDLKGQGRGRRAGMRPRAEGETVARTRIRASGARHSGSQRQRALARQPPHARACENAQVLHFAHGSRPAHRDARAEARARNASSRDARRASVPS